MTQNLSLSKLSTELVLDDPALKSTRSRTVIGFHNGLIRSVQSLNDNESAEPFVVIPALTNAHDHARSLKSSTIGAFQRPLESWLPMMGLLPKVDPYLVSANAFIRALKGGVTSLMVHYTRVQGGMPFVDEVLSVARAARDVGIQIGFAVAVRDQNGVAYANDQQVRAFMSPHIEDSVFRRLSASKVDPQAFVQSIKDLNFALKESGLEDVMTLQMGPNGVQWCSRALLEAIAKESSLGDYPVHMHLLETRYQRVWADQEFPQGVVNYLDELGLLSPRLTLAHCTWARTHELELLAKRGVTIAINASSNLHLRSGIAPVGQMIKIGCNVAMGLDGLALDEDDDAIREMRLNALLHSGWGFEEQVSLAKWWSFASKNGRKSVLGAAKDLLAPSGLIQEGYAADLICLDMSALDDEGGVVPDVDCLDKLMSRAHKGHIQRVYARGKIVLDAGVVTGLDEVAMKKELLASYRKAISIDPDWTSWQDDLNKFHQAASNFYGQTHWMGCE